MQPAGYDWSLWIEGYRERLDSFVAEARTLVNMDSPSLHKDLSDRVADHLEQRLTELGAAVERVPLAECGDCVIGRWPDRHGNYDNPLLLGGHYDTVWPEGEAARRPFTVEGNLAKGPGVYDMKGGIALGLQVIEAIRERDVNLPYPVTMLLNGDEEIGSVYTRGIWEREGKKSRAALILEPAPRVEHVYTARKGIACFNMYVEGIAAHSGGRDQDSVSAIDELAYQILQLQALSNYEKGTTCNVGTIAGGVARNVIAPHAEALFELRAIDPEEMDRGVQRILSLQPKNPRAKVRVEGGVTRPPLPETERALQLFAAAQAAAGQFGLDLKATRSGGGSDANLLAPTGIPVLDGLGVVGSGAHAYHEHIVLEAFPLRATLLTALIVGLPEYLTAQSAS